MSHKQGVAVIVLLCVLVALWGSGVVQTPMLRKSWEYKIFSPRDFNFEMEVNAMGADGWELVSARRATSSDGGSPSYEMIFKRPVR